MSLQQVVSKALPRIDREDLRRRYEQVREMTHLLCRPLVTEDYVIQSMPDVSPTKWHLAHTSWFFETFVLARAEADYRPFDPRFGYLFNSYYVTVGERHCRPRRGLLSRPTVEQVYRYREHVDRAMRAFLERAEQPRLVEFAAVVEIGLHHEQQHQELILTDIKHVLSVNPLRPAYHESPPLEGHDAQLPAMKWVTFDEGLRWIGHEGNGFAYDNESPRHRVWLDGFAIASRLVTCGEYLRFIEDGGYERPELWLSEGWNAVQNNRWESPLYWFRDDGKWMIFTLGGVRPVNEDEPVCHVSFFEAEAYARWAEARLPAEAEWEAASERAPIQGNFVEEGHYHPRAFHSLADGQRPPDFPWQLFGDVWEWTRSQYDPYPGYRPPPGALGEYNGKFMCNQFVLRGGSCATSRTHIRRTYRNFFPPDARWQFTGIRLAKERP